ncbi:MAG TPA: hypothetical protein VEW69_11330 [Alphaproteobacteria bacterium]|nr:hypothetical protein [Alphaproteobacteria bacterium]
MKILFGVLVFSVAVALVAILATWLRLRWHLRRPDKPIPEPALEIHSEEESLKQG